MHELSRARKAPAGMRLKNAMQLLISGDTRIGICGYAGSGGWALSTEASAMPTPSAPSSRAFALTISAVNAMRLSWHNLRLAPHLGETAGRPTTEGAMDELKVVRLDETDVVKFGPDAVYQLILGDDEGTTPIRTGIQTSQPGYVAPVHSHPYMEVLHSFRVVGDEVLRLSARTLRPSGSSTTRTARRATRAAIGFSRPDAEAGDRPASDSLDVRATEEPPRADEQRRDQHQVGRDVAEPAADDRIQVT